MRQKLTGSRLSKSRYSTNFQARFVRKQKSFIKNFWIKKRDLSISCLMKESASILEQTSRSYGGLKLGLFVQFQRVSFGKSTHKAATKSQSLKYVASYGHASILAIAKVRQNGFCCHHRSSTAGNYYINYSRTNKYKNSFARISERKSGIVFNKI